MTLPIALTGGEMAAGLRPEASDREKLSQVAREFEAIFLRQMLSAARKTDFGGDDLFGSQGEETFNEMRDAHFADLVAESSMVGLAPSIEAQLSRYLGPEG